MQHSPGGPDPKMDTSHAQIGVVGEHARVYGGIHFYTSPTRSLDLLPFNLGTNIRNFLLNYLGTSEHPVPFGGREEDLQRLEQWRTQSEKRFLLLAAPAGRGKSALLCRWAERLSQADASKTVAVVFVPISSRFSTNLPELVFACIAVQLALVLGEEVPTDYINMPTGFWQSLVGEYLRRPLPDGRQLLLIVDGLDEAAWDIGPSLFPLVVPATTRIVVSARYLAGDVPGSGPWLGRLGWEDFKLAEAMSLDTLTRDGLGETLASMRRPLAKLLDGEDIIDRLYGLTSGDPLLANLYVNMLSKKDESAVWLRPEDLEHIEKGYQGFFNFWWKEQEKLWAKMGQGNPLEKRTVMALLSILVTALGPLSISDVKAVMPAELSPTKYTILQAVKPLGRFVVGDGDDIGFSFAHTRLNGYFRETLHDPEEWGEWQTIFVRWGLSAIQKSQGGKSSISPYLLQYLSWHLSLAEEPVESFLSLLTYEWLTGWHRYAGTYTGFLRDVDTIMERLVATDRRAIAQGLPAPYIGQEIKCVLCHASVAALASNMPRELLVALCRYGDWTDEQVLAYAQQKPDPEERALALIELAPYLHDVKQQQAYQNALQVALPNEYALRNVLIPLAPHLPESVFLAANRISNDMWRKDVLVSLAPYLPEAGYHASLSRTDTTWRLSLLIAWAPYLPEAVYQTTLSLLHPYDQKVMLTTLAPHLPGAVYHAALTLQDDRYRAEVLIALASHLPGVERTEALRQAHHAALSLQDATERSIVLSALAPYLPEEVYHVALSLQDELSRSSVLRALAPYLPEEVYQATLSLQEPWPQASVLNALILYLPEAKRTEVIQLALQAALSVPNGKTRNGMLISLVPHLPRAKRDEALGLVLQSALSLKDELDLADALFPLVPYLPNEVFQAVLFSKREYVRHMEVLIALVPYLPEAKQAEAILLTTLLQEVMSVRDKKTQRCMLSALALQTPEAVYQAALSLQDPLKRARALSAVVPRMPEIKRAEALQLALQAALFLGDERARASLLSALAPRLPEAIYRASLFLHDELARASVLSALAPYLPDAERSEAIQLALQAALSLQDESDRVRALIGLTPYLPEAIYEAALSLEDKLAQVRLLCALAPHVPKMKQFDTLGLAFDTARGMKEWSKQISALCAVAPYLSEALRARILKQALETYQTTKKSFGDEDAEAALLDLTPHLPETLYKWALEAQMMQNRIYDLESARILSALAPYLPEAVYQAALSVKDEEARIRVLSKLAGFLITFPIDVLYAQWEATLTVVRRLRRSDALPLIADLIPAVEVLGGESALLETFRSVEEVCRWWP